MKERGETNRNPLFYKGFDVFSLGMAQVLLDMLPIELGIAQVILMIFREQFVNFTCSYSMVVCTFGKNYIK
jgi:hypothetical protein